MKSLKTYSIPFTGLKLGKHLFEYEIGDEFFSEFEYSLVKKASLQCKVELDKQETMLILNFDITGAVTATCDTCLAEYQQPVDVKEQQIYRFTEEDMGEDDEIITLGKNDHEINITGLIYEYVNVALPFVAYCDNQEGGKQCDEEMLDNLNKLSVNDDEETEKTDPRWEALKKLK
ncbi:YceD family protein [Mucilaginibacter pedocola]|uniref:DNA-binding protein n=1 Tax=Mucilaginibacter pedocola TaxID=1792845 RepID=A0A1S9PJV5_9SPHI|nr:DUF177 domain-containing protein [Mucilaginibacter pedocola]OOQ61243.1 hypothetical protein BC343_19840 [Mucilaginibacter pedocola]